MKGKIIIALAAVMMLSSVCAVNVSAKGGGRLGNLVELLLAVVGLDDSGIPCWSAYDCPKDCTSHFVYCAPCLDTVGIPTGGQGMC